MARTKQSWPQTRLRSLIKEYIGGGWGSDSSSVDFPEPAGVIRGTDIPGALVGDVSGIPKRFHKTSNVRSRKLQPGDIIFEVSGGSKDQPVGRALHCSDRLLSSIGEQVIPASFCKRLVPDGSKANSRFIYYALKAMYDDRRIAQWQVQSTGISNFQFEAFLDECEIGLPPLDVQRRIASAISAYDNLIENNTRRIGILEEMARRIYEEWFVHFRFPGHEQVKMADSELGKIPEGWSLEKVGSVVERLPAGQTYKKENLSEHGRVMVIDQSTSDYLGFHDLDVDHPATVETPKIIFGDHTCKLKLMLRPFSVGPNTIPFVGANGFDSVYIFQLVQGLVHTQEYKRHWTDFSDKQVALCPKQLASQYGSTVRNLLKLAMVLDDKTRNLRATRNLLLPKLISGELDVSNLPEPEEAIAA